MKTSSWMIPLVVLAPVLALGQDEKKTSEPPPAKVAIVGAEIILAPGMKFGKGSILIENGRITRVATGNVDTAGYFVVDGTGMVAYPGFIDGYTARALKDTDPIKEESEPDSVNSAPPTMWEQNRRGVTPQLIAANRLNLKDYVKDFYQQGLLVGHMANGRGLVRGQTSLILFLDADPKEITLNASFGMEFGFRGQGRRFGGGRPPGQQPNAQPTAPTTNTNYPQDLLGMIALLRQTLYDGQRYGILAGSKPEGFKEDLVLASMQPALQAASPAIFYADTDRDMNRALQISEEFNLKPILTSCREGSSMIERLRTNQVPVLLNISIGEDPSIKPDESLPKAVVVDRADQWKEKALTAKNLIDGGVRVAFTSDGDVIGSYLQNVHSLISLGLPAEKALAAMTTSPAALFGLSKDFGTIEVGKVANIVLMNSDLADPKSQVETVVVKGQVVVLRAKKEKSN